MNEYSPEKQRESSPVDIEEIEMLRNIAMRDDYDGFVKKQQEFLKQVEKNHPDFENWLVYHALKASTIVEQLEGQAIKEDFPGDDSVLQFLQKYLGISG